MQGERTDDDERTQAVKRPVAEVFVLNIGGYIGDSTRSEIEYAKAHGKPIVYEELGE